MAGYIGIPEREILSTTWLTGLDKTGDFPNKANFRTIGKTQNTEYYTIYWKILAVRTLKEIIRRYAIKTFGYYEKIISCRYSQMLDCIQKYGNMNEELSELLDETNRCLEKEGKVVVITYDSLDFCMDREVRGGLISELLAFWAENNLRYQGLRAKIFLRNDIFKKEVMLTDKIKLNNYRGNIEWTYDYLLAMLWKRMMEADIRLKERLKGVLEKAGYSLEESKLVGIMPRPSEEINKVILNALVGEKMGKGNKTYTYNWIIYRLADANLKIVPRSMIKLFSSAARLEEMEEGNRKWEKILSPKSLKNSADDVSADRVADMKEEYSEYKQIFEDLRKYCSLFPADEEIFYSVLVKCGIQKEELKTVVDHLIEIGVLKVYEKKKKDAPVRYHIPDIYLTGMGLTRKGDR